MSFKETWGCWLTLVGIILLAIILAKLGWLEIAHVSFAILFGCIFCWFLIHDHLEKRRHKRQGFSVEPMGPGQLRAGDDDWSVTYYEGMTFFSFKGKIFPKSKYVLFIPSEAYWPKAVPEFIADRRDLVLSRIQQELARTGYKNIYTIQEIDGDTRSER